MSAGTSSGPGVVIGNPGGGTPGDDTATGSHLITAIGSAVLAGGSDSANSCETLKFSDGASHLTDAGLTAVEVLVPVTNLAGTAAILGTLPRAML